MISEFNEDRRFHFVALGNDGQYSGVSRQEKWHSMRHDVRRGLQVFSCMQENT
jgi:hypothetical protein